MKIAAVQLNSKANKRKNILKALCLVEQAGKEGAKLIALPEVFNYRGAMGLSLPISHRSLAPGDFEIPILRYSDSREGIASRISSSL